MPNLSYCRFRNTRPDLTDCAAYIDDEVSKEEAASRKAIILKCIEVARMFTDDKFTVDMEAIDALPVEEDEE